MRSFQERIHEVNGYGLVFQVSINNLSLSSFYYEEFRTFSVIMNIAS